MNKPILLVEDNDIDEMFALRAIAANNISNKVIVAHDGEEALHLLFGEGEYALPDGPLRPAVILLDLRLPKVSGLEVLRQIRANELTRLLPVVVMTSSKEDQDVVESYSLGANSYVRKPIKFDDLVSAISKLGMFWLLLNEHPDRNNSL